MVAIRDRASAALPRPSSERDSKLRSTKSRFHLVLPLASAITASAPPAHLSENGETLEKAVLIANHASTCLYDRLKMRLEDNLAFRSSTLKFSCR
jgi:hypothetical protein